MIDPEPGQTGDIDAPRSKLKAYEDTLELSSVPG
jgi:hypothetical protein